MIASFRMESIQPSEHEEQHVDDTCTRALTKPGSDRIGLDRTGLTKPGPDVIRLTKPGSDLKKSYRHKFPPK